MLLILPKKRLLFYKWCPAYSPRLCTPHSVWICYFRHPLLRIAFYCELQCRYWREWTGSNTLPGQLKSEAQRTACPLNSQSAAFHCLRRPVQPALPRVIILIQMSSPRIGAKSSRILNRNSQLCLLALLFSKTGMPVRIRIVLPFDLLNFLTFTSELKTKTFQTSVPLVPSDNQALLLPPPLLPLPSTVSVSCVTSLLLCAPSHTQVHAVPLFSVSSRYRLHSCIFIDAFWTISHTQNPLLLRYILSCK